MIDSTHARSLPLDPATLRDDFPILATRLHDDRVPLAYLDNGASTQRPRQVIQAMVDLYERHYSNVHRGIHQLSEQSTELYEAAREKVRKFIHAPQWEEVIFTRGTTESINLVARSWGDANVREGDEILLTEMEHHANIVPWHQLAQRSGAKVRWIPLTDDGQLRLDLLDELLTPRTRLVSVTAISNVLGTVNPIKAIAEKAHQAGALVLVDAAQSIAHRKTDVQELGADFVVFSGHKMLGPSGIGVLWGRRELLEGMPAFLGGGSMIRRVTLEGFEPADLPNKFEAGTPPIAPAIGLGAAIDYLNAVGLHAIHEYDQLLTARAWEVLNNIEGLQILGPPVDRRSSIISFTLQGLHAHDVAQLLDRQGVAVRAGHHCTMPLHKRLGISASARASFFFYNTLEEVDRLGEALQDAKRVFRRR